MKKSVCWVGRRCLLSPDVHVQVFAPYVDAIALDNVYYNCGLYNHEVVFLLN